LAVDSESEVEVDPDFVGEVEFASYGAWSGDGYLSAFDGGV
jgi:hypothetical protein